MNKDYGCLSSGLKLTTILAIIVAICFVLFSCTKTQVIDRYEMVIDWHNLDSSMKKKSAYVQVLDERIESVANELWYTDCNMLDVLQHLYYTKNGKQIYN
jgi:hypothetical protein